MDWGLLLAVVAALSTAGATIAQAIGVRRAKHFHGVDPRLLLSLVRSWPYILGLTLLTASFLLTLVALHNTPLFVVQAIGAASLAVIAAVYSFIYRTRLHLVEWAAIGAVFAGVVLLVMAQRSSTAAILPPLGNWALLGAAAVMAIIAFVARRALAGAAVPGLLSGLAFGDAAVASRVVAGTSMTARTVLVAPVAYSVAVAGLLGVLLYATALQRGSITAVFGMSTVGQTLGPALTGWLVLGDRIAPGMVPSAVVGFVLAVGGAILLGRHAHPGRARHVHLGRSRRAHPEKVQLLSAREGEPVTTIGP